jgi:hypothetical protein
MSILRDIARIGRKPRMKPSKTKIAQLFAAYVAASEAVVSARRAARTGALGTLGWDALADALREKRRAALELARAERA